jgi:hypothetical protein
MLPPIGVFSAFGREKRIKGLKRFPVLKTAAFRHGWLLMQL